MKRRYIFFSASALLVLLVACDKMLDPEPHQNLSEEISPGSDQGVKKVLIGAYARFAGPRQIFLKETDPANEDIISQFQAGNQAGRHSPE